MDVGFVQFDPVFGNKQKNFVSVKNLLTQTNADIIVLPELFSTGYTFLNQSEVNDMAESASQGETLSFIQSLTREMNCAIGYGFAERSGGGCYNSASLVTPEGRIGTYRKVHLFKEEKQYFQPGNNGFPVFEWKNTKIGMLVCYDWIYPEATRTLALKGAQIILHPANLIMPFCPNANITRALENRVFIITANRIGCENRAEKSNTFIGQSQIVSPEGEILVRCGTEECVKVSCIEPRNACNKKVNEYNDIFRDRREDTYFK